jgi:hypothetical protein
MDSSPGLSCILSLEILSFKAVTKLHNCRLVTLISILSPDHLYSPSPYIPFSFFILNLQRQPALEQGPITNTSTCAAHSSSSSSPPSLVSPSPVTRTLDLCPNPTTPTAAHPSAVTKQLWRRSRIRAWAAGQRFLLLRWSAKSSVQLTTRIDVGKSCRTVDRGGEYELAYAKVVMARLSWQPRSSCLLCSYGYCLR